MKRVTVDAAMYRRVLTEAITNLEALDSADPRSPFANPDDIELLAYCRAQLERVRSGPIEAALRAARSVPIHQLPPNPVLRLPGGED